MPLKQLLYLDYELSFYLHNKLPADDTLTIDEKEKLVELMNEKYFYEINSFTRTMYSAN